LRIELKMPESTESGLAMATYSATAAAKANEFALMVRAGLLKSGQKELPSKYFYDSVGSGLFEVICTLPEYGLTRAEESILTNHVSEIVAKLHGPVMVAELGSGSGRKTRLILEELCRKQPTSYYPIEISRTALAHCERELSDVGCVSIVGFEREYLDGLLEVAARRQEGERLLVLFLGSTIGNFDGTASTEFLRRLRKILYPGDFLLLGADLEKPIETLIAAYDDNLGVTAAFNLNVLVRINRELGGNFAIDQFQHVAIFNEQTRSVEMHLRSWINQRVSIPAARISVDLKAGETIWTETSHKYSLPELNKMARESEFRCVGTWLEKSWQFVENLWVAE
jgi:L-histidine N-alpha-methyltransferase